MSEQGMFSNKPYLITAFYNWIVDNGCTPYLMVNAQRERVQVPEEFVRNGEIVFNLKPEAVRDLDLGKRTISFRATFGGVEQELIVPVVAVKAIYAMENGEGMMFDTDESEDDMPPEEGGKSKGAPFLRVLD